MSAILRTRVDCVERNRPRFCTAFTGDAFVYYRVETVSIGIFAKKTIVTLLRL